MIVITKAESTIEKVVTPKGTRGLVVAVRFGDKEGYVVDFPQNTRVFILKEDVTIEGANNVSKEPLETKKKRQSGKQEREEEMQTSFNNE
jgi:hypothetical protein